MSSNTAIGSISPRLQPTHALGHITSLSANLVALADEMGVSFFDNPEQFFVHNKEVSDGYLFDQVQLNIKGSNKLAQSMGLIGNTSDHLDISSIYAMQTKPSTWTNRPPKYVAPGLRLKTGDSTRWSHEGARHGQRGTAGTQVTSLPNPMRVTRGPQSEAQGRRTEESKRSVTQNNDNDFHSPFWNKARVRLTNRWITTIETNKVMHKWLHQPILLPLTFVYIVVKTIITQGSADMAEKSNVMNVIVWATKVNCVICIHVE